MEVMIERSHAFVIFPGGAGTVQEMLALMIFQQQRHPDMEGKPVVVFNRVDEQGRSFWTPLIALLKNFCPDSSFKVVTQLDDLIPCIKQKLGASV
jgi:predicted Rossmann-fold nucleotide-binding protein